MKTFKQYINEAKMENQKNKKMWSDIEPYDRGLPEPHKSAVDSWVGTSHEEMDNMKRGGKVPEGLMIPNPLETSHEQVHAQNQKLRDVISRHHGTHITAYRGTTPEGAQSNGRLNLLSSWTTNKKAALYFGGGDVSKKKTAKIYSPKEIETYNEILNKKGKIKVGQYTYRKNKDGYVDKYDNRGGHIGDAESLHDHFNSHNEFAKEYNSELALNRKTASKNIVKKKIPINDIVHATDRTGQQELIVRN